MQNHSKSQLLSLRPFVLVTFTLILLFVSLTGSAEPSRIEVITSAQTPFDRVIPRGTTNIPMLTVDLINHGDEDVAIVNMAISHFGLGDEDDIDEVKVLDGFQELGSGRSFTNDDHIAPLNLSVEPIFVPANSTRTVTLAARLHADAVLGMKHALGVLGPHHLNAVGVESGASVPISGHFPILGMSQEVGAIDVGRLDFEFRTVADNELEVGEQNVELATFDISETSGEEDVLIRALTLEFEGLDAGDLGNLYLESGGRRISKIDDLSGEDLAGEDITFDFTDSPDGGFVIGDGDSRVVRLRADILGASDTHLQLAFDDIETDVIATGLRYGFGVQLAQRGKQVSRAVKILGGDINFTINSSSRDFATDTDNLSFGTLTISNLGEAVEVQDGFSVLLHTAGGSFVDLQDVRLVDLESGATVLGPEDPAPMGRSLDGASEIAKVAFARRLRLDAGETRKLRLMANIGAAAVGTEFFLEFSMSTVEVEGLVSNDSSSGGAAATEQQHDIIPKGNITTATYRIQPPTLELAVSALAGGISKTKTGGQLLWEGTFRANDPEDLIVRQLTFVQTGASRANQRGICSIYVRKDSVRTLLETGEDLDGGVVTFSQLDEDGQAGLVIPAGTEMAVEIFSDRLGMPLELSDIDVEDEDGDDAVVVPLDP